MITTIPNRCILRITGDDRYSFLQGLLSNDAGKARPGTAAYACLLTPQGRFLHDMLLLADQEALYLTPETSREQDLLDRLNRYRLRSKVQLELLPDMHLLQSFQPLTLPLSAPDPRHPDLGYMGISPTATHGGDYPAYDTLRIRLGIPDGSRDMIVEQGILLENNVDKANGIDWNKGCYVGQELTARTHYRGLVRKHLRPLQCIQGTMPAFDTVLLQGDIEVGRLRSTQSDLALALLRDESLQTSLPLQAADATFIVRNIE